MDESLFSDIQDALLRWFAANRRPLPWRRDYTPYRTWIAEVMMQQTQMDRGIQYFNRWMDRFPDIASVADATEEDLLKAWEGLGYYRRARNIRTAAQVIMQKHGGVFPSEHAVILALPGIGAYTAGAIASTAFNQNVPCVDGNVERVFSRLFDMDTPVREEPAKSRIRKLAQLLIPPGKARDFNQGLMELGALICRKKPACHVCPLAQWCLARERGTAGQRPVPGRKHAVVKVDMVCGVVLHEEMTFIQRRMDNDVWGGLWEFPGGVIEPGETPEQAVRREWMEELGFVVEVVRPLATIRHSYTFYRVTLRCFLLRFSSRMPVRPEPPVLTAATDWRWIAPEKVDDYALPSPHRALAETPAFLTIR